jgi:hypothetical protein
MPSTPLAIDLINPEDTLPEARRAFPQSGRHAIVAVWIESAVNNWLRKKPSCATSPSRDCCGLGIPEAPGLRSLISVPAPIVQKK